MLGIFWPKMDHVVCLKVHLVWFTMFLLDNVSMQKLLAELVYFISTSFLASKEMFSC